MGNIRHKVRKLLHPVSFAQFYKWVIFTMFAGFFIVNMPFYQTLAYKIEDELIGAYRQASTPLNSFVEVTKTLSPTIEQQEPTKEVTPTEIVAPTKARVLTSKAISEDELWSALSDYRKSHGKGELSRSDKLCQYGRKRAQELSDRLKTKPEDPLDQHAGFKRDADSGYVFEFTGFNQVGENLAYTPAYTKGIQVIEWGWDTSAGHKALQLSDTVTHGCLTGIHPIYVGIFGS